jgi:hypothetical protein
LGTANGVLVQPLSEVAILFEDELQSLADHVIGGVRSDELGVTLHRGSEWLIEPDVVFVFRNGWLWGLKQRHGSSFSSSLDLWQELPASFGRICPKVLARIANECWQALVCERRGKKRTGDNEASSPWPGATPEARRGFGVIATPKMGSLPATKCFLPRRNLVS